MGQSVHPYMEVGDVDAHGLLPHGRLVGVARRLVVVGEGDDGRTDTCTRERGRRKGERGGGEQVIDPPRSCYMLFNNFLLYQQAHIPASLTEDHGWVDFAVGVCGAVSLALLHEVFWCHGNHNRLLFQSVDVFHHSSGH